jgi:hypothetical protein
MIDIYNKKTMKFGLLKSKIEKYLLESYGRNLFKDELKIFKKLVLENKNLKKLFFVYDELNTNKGYTKDIADQFINECITIYENTINKINPKDLKVLELWVDDVKSENQYDDIDNLFSTNILTLENKIKSRKIISESLIKKSKDENSDVINLPISTMVNIANQTINKYISELNESDKKSLISLLKEDDNKLNSEFDILKIDIISKLNEIKKTSDIETSKRIDESIEKITTEKYDKLTYFKLKNLKENL